MNKPPRPGWRTEQPLELPAKANWPRRRICDHREFFTWSLGAARVERKVLKRRVVGFASWWMAVCRSGTTGVQVLKRRACRQFRYRARISF